MDILLVLLAILAFAAFGVSLFLRNKKPRQCPSCNGSGVLASPYEGSIYDDGNFRKCPHCSGNGVV